MKLPEKIFVSETNWTVNIAYRDYRFGIQKEKIDDTEPVTIEYHLAPQWVSVEDRLPEEGIWSLLFSDGNRVYGMLWWKGNPANVWKALVITEQGAEFCTIKNVTHWMPLPAPPEDV